MSKNISNTCLACDYVGKEKVCPDCGMLTEEQCPKCKRAISQCVCSLVTKTKIKPSSPKKETKEERESKIKAVKKSLGV